MSAILYNLRGGLKALALPVVITAFAAAVPLSHCHSLIRASPSLTQGLKMMRLSECQ